MADLPVQNERALAEIESDLLKGEAAYADADTRLREAERDRSVALETINTHQLEFDKAIAGLRQRSTPGSNWRPGSDGHQEALILKTEDISVDASAEARPPAQAVAKEFERLKFAVQHSDRANGIPPVEASDGVKAMVSRLNRRANQVD